MLERFQSLSVVCPVAVLRVAAGVTLEQLGRGEWIVTTPADTLRFKAISSAVQAALESICESRYVMPQSFRRLLASGADVYLHQQLSRLWSRGVFELYISRRDETLFYVQLFGPADLWPVSLDLSDEVVLTTSAAVYLNGGSLICDSLSSSIRVVVSDEQLAAAMLRMTRPINLALLCHRMSLPEADFLLLVSWLVYSGALKIASTSKSDHVGEWEFADRLMHARSRFGRHVGWYGKRMSSYVACGTSVSPLVGDRSINLSRPDMEHLARFDLPLSAVLEERHSRREHANTPITLDELAHFLYRSLGARFTLSPSGQETLSRPYPAGGGVYEIEVYPLINRCDKLDSGLYRYNAVSHTLEHIADPGPETAVLLQSASASMRTGGLPHILLILVADFEKIQSRYNSIAYSLILKHVGVIYQTMSLVAAAMNLAACALGGGGADDFCKVAGCNFWSRSAVGEFTLGRSL